MTEHAELILPPDFEDDEANFLRDKGWYSRAAVLWRGVTYPITFYDPVRLAQDVALSVESRGFFVEENILVISEVTRAHMERVVRESFPFCAPCLRA